MEKSKTRLKRLIAAAAAIGLVTVGVLAGCTAVLANRLVQPPNNNGPQTSPERRARLVDLMGLQRGTIETAHGELVYFEMPAKPMEISLTASFQTQPDAPDSANIQMSFEPSTDRSDYVQPIGTIISLHGFGLDKESMPGYASMFADAGFDVFMVDLPGHGESTGEFVTYSLREADAVGELLTQLSQKGEAGPIIVFGVSLGGAVAVRTAATTELADAVIAIEPFENPTEVIPNFRHRAPAYLRWAISDLTMRKAIQKAERKAGFEFADSRIAPLLDSYATPTLLLHSAEDSLVPASQSKALAVAASNATLIIDQDGMDHGSYPLDVGQRCAEIMPWLIENLDVDLLGQPCAQIASFDELRQSGE